MSHRPRCEEHVRNPIRPTYPLEASGPEEEERAEECREVKSRAPPKGPTAEQWRTHRISHYPFRSWCPHCVAARAKSWPHLRQDEEEEQAVPTICFDYCFFRDKPGGDSIPVLVGRERKSKMILAHAVPFKGGGVDWLVCQLQRDLRKLGLHDKVILKSDQENAVIDVLNSLCKARGKDSEGKNITLVEASPKGESQSNGVAERAVQEIEEGVRTHKLDIESKVGELIPITHAIIPWMIENVADLLNKQCVGKDGKTPYERLKGKGYRGEFLEFGSSILHRVPDKPQGGLMVPRWVPGTWLGKRFTTDEHVISLDDGKVVRTRSVRAKPEEDSWNIADINKVKGQPWDPSMTLTYAKLAEQRFPTIPELTPAEEEYRPKPRANRITAAELEKTGWTIGCPKCRAMQEGDTTKGTVGHSAKCKARIKDILAEDEDFKRKMAKEDARMNKYCEEDHIARTATAAAGAGSSSDRPDEPPAPPPAHPATTMDTEDAEMEIPVILEKERSEDEGEEAQVERPPPANLPTQVPAGGEKRRREDDDQGDDDRMNRVDDDGDDMIGHFSRKLVKSITDIMVRKPRTHEEMIQRDMMNLKDDEPLDLQASISAKGGERVENILHMMWPKSSRPLVPPHGPEQGA